MDYHRDRHGTRDRTPRKTYPSDYAAGSSNHYSSRLPQHPEPSYHNAQPCDYPTTYQSNHASGPPHYDPPSALPYPEPSYRPSYQSYHGVPLARDIKALLAYPERTQTKWTTIEDLKGKHGGWTIERYEIPADDTTLHEAYEYLGIRPKDGRRYCVQQSEVFEKKVERVNDYGELETKRKIRGPTGAMFTSDFNYAGGSIVASMNISPTHCQDEDNNDQPFTPDRIPDISNWSDVIGALWSAKAGKDAKYLRYVFRQDIMRLTPDQTSISPTYQKIENLNIKIGSWRHRVKFMKGSPEFDEMLRTPHGKSVAYLLIDHPEEFGPEKDIESIRIFSTSDVDRQGHSRTAYHTLFELTEWPGP